MYAFLGNYRVPYYSKLFLFEANGDCKDQNSIKPHCSYFMCEVIIEGLCYITIMAEYLLVALIIQLLSTFNLKASELWFC